MSKNKNKQGIGSKKAAKLVKKIDETGINRMLASKEMLDPVKTISEHVNKKYRIKGLDKPVKKMLLRGCIHGTYNKKGRYVPRQKQMVDDNSNAYFICRICGSAMDTTSLAPEDFDKVYESYRSAVSQIGMMKGLLQLGGPAYRAHFAEMNRMWYYKKINSKVLELSMKLQNSQGGLGGKKHNKNGGKNDNGFAGSWY